MAKTGLVYSIGVEDSYGVSPMHLAAFGGSLTLLQWMEALGGDIYKTDKLGRNVLTYAVNGRKLKVL